jgi:hypothetical protein
MQLPWVSPDTSRKTVIRCVLLEAVRLEPLLDHISTAVSNLNRY